MMRTVYLWNVNQSGTPEQLVVYCAGDNRPFLDKHLIISRLLLVSWGYLQQAETILEGTMKAGRLHGKGTT